MIRLFVFLHLFSLYDPLSRACLDTIQFNGGEIVRCLAPWFRGSRISWNDLITEFRFIILEQQWMFMAIPISLVACKII